MRAIARCLIVASTIFAWIAISNHCAFRALATKTETAQTGCPFHSKPAKPQQSPAGTECCKILRAISSTPVKALAPSLVDLSEIRPELAEIATPSATEISFATRTLDTGPPGKTAFVELSPGIRAHAPPFFI